MKSIRARLNYANVIATIALFAALGTGGAYAANTIGSTDVIDESLLSEDIKNFSLKGVDIAANTVGSGNILDSSLSGTDVANSTLTGADVSDSTLTGFDVAPNALTGADVDESMLQKVPSAATADHATTAGTAAVSGFIAISSYSAYNSETSKAATAYCPAGKSVVGIGWDTGGENDDVFISSARFGRTQDGISYARVQAQERGDGVEYSWRATAQAICVHAVN